MKNTSTTSVDDVPPVPLVNDTSTLPTSRMSHCASMTWRPGSMVANSTGELNFPVPSAFAVPTFSSFDVSFTSEPGAQPVPDALSWSPGWMLSLSSVSAPSASIAFVVDVPLEPGADDEDELESVVVVVVTAVVVVVVVVTTGGVVVVVTTGGVVVVVTGGGVVVVVTGGGMTTVKVVRGPSHALCATTVWKPAVALAGTATPADPDLARLNDPLPMGCWLSHRTVTVLSLQGYWKLVHVTVNPSPGAAELGDADTAGGCCAPAGVTASTVTVNAAKPSTPSVLVARMAISRNVSLSAAPECSIRPQNAVLNLRCNVRRLTSAAGSLLLVGMLLGSAQGAFAAAGDVTVNATVDRKAVGGTTDLLLDPDRSIRVEVTVHNGTNAPRHVKTVRLSGTALALTFFAYDTTVPFDVPAKESVTRAFQLDLADLGGQATGLLPTEIEVLDDNRDVLGSVATTGDVLGSMWSVYAVFGLGVLLLTVFSWAGALIALARRRLPANRWQRAMRFLPAGIGTGLVAVISLSVLKLMAPSPAAEIPFILGSAAAALLLGYLTPHPGDPDALRPADDADRETDDFSGADRYSTTDHHSDYGEAPLTERITRPLPPGGAV